LKRNLLLIFEGNAEEAKIELSLMSRTNSDADNTKLQISDYINELPNLPDIFFESSHIGGTRILSRKFSRKQKRHYLSGKQHKKTKKNKLNPKTHKNRVQHRKQSKKRH